MWGIIISAFCAVAAIGGVYLAVAVSRFGGIKKLARDRKSLSFVISLAIIAVVFFAAVMITTSVNAVIILLHFIAFFIFSGLLVKLVEKIRGKEFRHYIQGWLGIVVSVVYLLIGYYLANNVWQENYSLKTDKNVGTIRIAMIADSHLGATFGPEGFAKHLKEIEASGAQMLLIAGDFVDDGTTREDMLRACQALGEARFEYGVYLSWGNHDPGYFRGRSFTLKELTDELEKNGVRVLNDESVLIDGRIYIVGRRDRSAGSRKSIEELLAGLDTDKYIIVLDHQPNDYDNEAASAADLVLSGHTHGGQLFPWTTISKLIKVDDRVYGYERRNGTDFIVTSGISDWEIKFKTGTKSEYVIIDVE